MTEFSNIPWISDGKRPSWVQDDDLMQFSGSSFAAKHWPLDVAGIRYFFPTTHPYSICAEYNAKHPDRPQMVPWNPKPGEKVGGPEDWHRSSVLLRDGYSMLSPTSVERWNHLASSYDIVGYVPKASTSSLAGEPKVEITEAQLESLHKAQIASFDSFEGPVPVAGASGSTGEGYVEAEEMLRDLISVNDISATAIRVARDHMMQFVRRYEAPYNPDTHAIIDKSTHVAVRKRTREEADKRFKQLDSNGRTYREAHIAHLSELGIIIPDPDPIDTAAANNNIPPDALRAALKELGK